MTHSRATREGCENVKNAEFCTNKKKVHICVLLELSRATLFFSDSSAFKQNPCMTLHDFA